MADVFCNSCGHRNPVGSNFCSSCGAPLDVPEPDSTTATFQIAAVTEASDEEPAVERGDVAGGIGVLVVKRGENAGSRFVLDRPVTTAGRHPDSDIFLDDVTVSRRHVELVADDEGYRVRDVGSLNGTYLNRERIEEATLANGDELQIGKFKLVFFLGGDGAS